MNRLLSLAVAGVVSAALSSAGCENKNHDHAQGKVQKSSTPSASASTSADAAGGHAHASTGNAQVHASAGDAHAAADGHGVADVTPSGTVDGHPKPGDSVVTAPQGNAQPAAAAIGLVEAPGAAGKAARAQVMASKAPGMDDVKGVVEFTPLANGVKVTYDIQGLTPNGKHGFHIHEKGDLSTPDFASAGPHFNPNGEKHGGPESDMRHGGDLGNITADANGRAKGEINVLGLTVDEGQTGIVGRSIVVHEKADDLATDPSGNSGARVGAGTIKMGGGGGGGSGKGKAGGDVGGDDNDTPQGEKDANNPKKRDKED